MQCLLPGSVRNPNPYGTSYIVAPCGKCPACRDRRINSWVFRLQQEEKVHTCSLFATLTYDQEALPWSDSGPTLYKPDLQNFFKRLRKATRRKSIKYYACGEYGTDTKRPHYHAIIFDVSASEVERAWAVKGKPIGHVHTANASGATMAYVAKYCGKPSKIGLHADDTRLKEFSLQSIGLGKNYLTPQVVAYHKKGQFSFVTSPGGTKHALPRYYRDKLFTKDELAWMNYEAQEKAQRDLDIRIRDAGGPDLYYRNRHAAIVYAVEKFHNQKADNRNKI